MGRSISLRRNGPNGPNHDDDDDDDDDDLTILNVWLLYDIDPTIAATISNTMNFLVNVQIFGSKCICDHRTYGVVTFYSEYFSLWATPKHM
ncbi:hypothetical protein ANN_18492 [Periplaneta americana]|uniref:Uncharacterized protein n=1 Tax=Periplaneta americana TaxID=6978 RepID=A0ABQ8SQ94_PERAM|nr:hypothetical protein ANN_18492 [Periplaneta americana]